MCDKEEPKVNPMIITGFNKHMIVTSAMVLILTFISSNNDFNLPMWVIVLLITTSWLWIVGGVIVCLGYIIAIVERKVSIIEIAKNNKKED